LSLVEMKDGIKIMSRLQELRKNSSAKAKEMQKLASKQMSKVEATQAVVRQFDKDDAREAEAIECERRERLEREAARRLEREAAKNSKASEDANNKAAFEARVEARRKMDVALEKKGLVEVQKKIQQILTERGLTVNELHTLFAEFDTSGDQNLDWSEFKAALKALGVKVPVAKMRQLFSMFDEDDTGEVDCHEFCHTIFPNMDVDASVMEPGVPRPDGNPLQQQPARADGTASDAMLSGDVKGRQ